MDLSTGAGRNFIKHHIEEAARLSRKIASIGDVVTFAKMYLKAQDIKSLFKLALGGVFDKHIYTEKHFLEPGNDPTLKRFQEYNPDIIIICSYRHTDVEARVKELLTGGEYFLRRQYWFPIVFLYKKSIVTIDDVFSDSIFSVKDLEDRM